MPMCTCEKGISGFWGFNKASSADRSHCWLCVWHIRRLSSALPLPVEKKLRDGLGNEYVEVLFHEWEKRVPPESDYGCYWLEKARVDSQYWNRLASLIRQSRILEHGCAFVDLGAHFADKDWRRHSKPELDPIPRTLSERRLCWQYYNLRSVGQTATPWLRRGAGPTTCPKSRISEDLDPRPLSARDSCEGDLP